MKCFLFRRVKNKSHKDKRLVVFCFSAMKRNLHCLLLGSFFRRVKNKFYRGKMVGEDSLDCLSNFQRVQANDKRYQYLLFAADLYEIIVFKVPSIEIDKMDSDKSTAKFSHWDPDSKNVHVHGIF